MRALVPCASCDRHVESHETACPFCGSSLAARPDSHACSGPCSGHPSKRLSRKTLAAVGATLLCASCLVNSTAAYGGMIVEPVDAGGNHSDGGQQPVDAAPADAGDGAADAHLVDADPGSKK